MDRYDFDEEERGVTKIEICTCFNSGADDGDTPCDVHSGDE